MMDRPRRTPRLSDHARLRCTQMAVPTKRVKRIAREADLVYPATSWGQGPADRWVAWSEEDPAIAVLYTEDSADAGQRVVVTVLWRHEADYARPGREAS
jgi:hypothetical protein